MFNLTKNYSISDFFRDLLKKRFPGDLARQEIVEETGEKLNFACPFCGDSAHDRNKKRGHFYLSTNNYKCYNDGCGIKVPLSKVVEKFANRYNLEIPNVSPVEFKPTDSSSRKGSIIEFLINKEIGKKLLVFSDLVNRFSLTPCSDASPDSAISKYVSSRKIDALPAFKKSCYFDSRNDKIYLFNLDLRSGRVLGFAIRRISEDWSGPKYDIKNYGEFKKTGLVSGLDDDFIIKVNTINNYFNVLNVDFTKPITLTEGQIDSMFVRNCIATTGVTKGQFLLDNLLIKKNTRILFDADLAGKKASLELLGKGYQVFLWSAALRDLSKKYRNDFKEIKKIKDVNDLFKYMESRDPGTTFDTFNLFLDNYFSNSQFDMLSI